MYKNAKAVNTTVVKSVLTPMEVTPVLVSRGSF